MTNRIDEINLDDPEVYDLVRKTNKLKNNEQKSQEQEQTTNDITSNYIIDETSVKNTNNNGTMFDFIKKIFIVCVCVFLIYLFIYRYMIGFDFLKNKQYTKSMAIMSPELLTLSSFLL